MRGRSRGLSRVRWKLSRTVLKGGTDGNTGPLLDTGPPKKRQPYHFHMQHGRPFAFAGLWECWNRDGESVESFTIITTQANELLAKYHDWMPVIVHPNDFDVWLRGEPDDAAVVLQPYPSNAMTAVAVSTRVNNPRNEGPELLAAV
jgi:putative SOS response-associated peptidase YedK